MAMTKAQALQLDSVSVAAEKASLGASVYGAPIVIKKAITADATAGVSIDIPFNFELYDVVVVCTAAVSSGTVLIKNGSTAITDAIVCAVDKVVVRAGTIDDTVSSITTASVITATTNASADRGIVYLLGYRS